MRHHTQEHLATNFVSTPEYLLLEIRRLSQSQESSLVFMGGHGASYSRDTTIYLASAPLLILRVKEKILFSLSSQ